jgi:hypothetical protein
LEKGAGVFRKFVAVASMSLLSGCIAAAMAPSLFVGGGSYVGIKAYTKGTMNDMDRKLVSANAIGGNLNVPFMKISSVQQDEKPGHWIAGTAIGRSFCTQLLGRNHATCAPLK